MFTHEGSEIDHMRKYGTPSEKLIKLAEMPINFKGRCHTFPVSLNTSKGQKFLYSIIKSLDAHFKAIPIKVHNLFLYAKENVTHRRSDTQTNLLLVAEAILHRAASEFKLQVLFAFDSINVWIKAVAQKQLGYHTLRKAIEILEEFGILKVLEWGVRGNRGKATKIELLPVMRRSILTYTSDLDDWLLSNDHAMMAVYRRESVTRQDVLESRFQHYMEAVALRDEEEALAIARMEDGTMERAFSKRANMDVSVDVIEESEDDLFSRLLGELVPTVQEAQPVVGQNRSGLRGSGRIDKGGGGSGGEFRADGRT